MESKTKLFHCVIAISSFIFWINSYAESIHALYLPNPKVGEAYYVTYKGVSALADTWREACKARG